jgi:hypothetical protein
MAADDRAGEPDVRQCERERQRARPADQYCSSWQYGSRQSNSRSSPPNRARTLCAAAVLAESGETFEQVPPFPLRVEQHQVSFRSVFPSLFIPVIFIFEQKPLRFWRDMAINHLFFIGYLPKAKPG